MLGTGSKSTKYFPEHKVEQNRKISKPYLELITGIFLSFKTILESYVSDQDVGILKPPKPQKKNWRILSLLVMNIKSECLETEFVIETCRIYCDHSQGLAAKAGAEKS